MEIEYLRERRKYQRINDANVIVYYKVIKDIGIEQNVKKTLSEQIFRDKVVRLNEILRNKGIKYEPIIEIVNAKINKLINLVDSLANPDMKISELIAVNLSASGIRFRIRDMFQQGDRIELLMILLPRIDLIDCQCEVMRVMDGMDDYGKYYDIGARYIFLDEDDRHKLINYVKVIIEGGPF